MADLEILEGDLEKLSSSISTVADTLDTASVSFNVTDASSAMPGSSSASLVSTVGTTLDDRRRTLKNRYTDFSDDVMAAANSHWANEEQARQSLVSAGVLPGETPLTDADRRSAAYLAMRARLE